MSEVSEFLTANIHSVPNGHMHSKIYGRVNARVYEKVFVLF